MCVGEEYTHLKDRLKGLEEPHRLETPPVACAHTHTLCSLPPSLVLGTSYCSYVGGGRSHGRVFPRSRTAGGGVGAHLSTTVINFNADQRISHQDDQEHEEEEEEEEELVENWLMKRVLEHFVSLASNTSL